MKAHSEKNPHVPPASHGPNPMHETSAIRELSARFDLEAITLIGSAHNGAWQRAIAVARRLVDAGIWNGADPIEFDACDLHHRLFGVARVHPCDLVAGDDYHIVRAARSGAPFA